MPLAGARTHRLPSPAPPTAPMPAMTVATAISCVTTMFGGVAGSEEQRQASQWALAFQDAPEAWLVCLELLSRTPSPDGSDVALLNFAAQVGLTRLCGEARWAGLCAIQSVRSAHGSDANHMCRAARVTAGTSQQGGQALELVPGRDTGHGDAGKSLCFCQCPPRVTAVCTPCAVPSRGAGRGGNKRRRRCTSLWPQRCASLDSPRSSRAVCA